MENFREGSANTPAETRPSGLGEEVQFGAASLSGTFRSVREKAPPPRRSACARDMARLCLRWYRDTPPPLRPPAPGHLLPPECRQWEGPTLGGGPTPVSGRLVPNAGSVAFQPVTLSLCSLPHLLHSPAGKRAVKGPVCSHVLTTRPSRTVNLGFSFQDSLLASRGPSL